MNAQTELADTAKLQAEYAAHQDAIAAASRALNEARAVYCAANANDAEAYRAAGAAYHAATVALVNAKTAYHYWFTAP